MYKSTRNDEFFTDYRDTLAFIHNILLDFKKTFFVKNGLTSSCFYVSGGFIPTLFDYYKNDLDAVYSKMVLYKKLKTKYPKMDIDLYVEPEPTSSFEHHVEPIKLKYSNVMTGEDPRYPGASKAISFNFSEFKTIPVNTVQIINMQYGKPEEIVSTFDFVHVQSFFRLDYEQLYITKKQLRAMDEKVLYPIGEVKPFRLTKWETKGWKLVDNT